LVAGLARTLLRAERWTATNSSALTCFTIAFSLWCLGIRVELLMLKIWSLGSGVWGLGFEVEVWGLGSGVEGRGSRVED